MPEIGIGSVWVNKNQLIEKILNSTQNIVQMNSTSENKTITSPPNQPSLVVADEPTSAQKSLEGMTNEITRLNNELTKTNSVLTSVMKRLAALEASYPVPSRPLQTPAPDSSPLDTLTNRLANLEKAVDHILTKVSCTVDTQAPPSRETPSVENRIQTLENTVTTLRPSHHSAKQNNINSLDGKTTVTANTLIIGDENLKNICATDLNENCKVRTLHHVTLDLMKCWVQEMLSWQPAKCIIYGGLTDIKENNTPEKTLDNLGALISELKLKTIK